MEAILAAALAAFAALAAALFTYRASTRKQRGDVGQQMIDQHQEDIKELRGETKAQWVRINQLEQVVRVQGDYIGQLRRHIADGQPPPPPPYPASLTT